jgi:hypothetical protein
MPTPSTGHRSRPRPLVPGKAVDVDPAELAELAAARAQLEAARKRLRNVTLRLERRLGDAEYGLAAGVPAIRREQSLTGGHYVRQNHRDDLRLLKLPRPSAIAHTAASHLRLAGADIPPHDEGTSFCTSLPEHGD